MVLISCTIGRIKAIKKMIAHLLEKIKVIIKIKPNQGKMNIQHLHLQTTHLQAQHHFYQEVLGLPTTPIKEQKFTTTIGHSQLHFEEAAQATPYHFAINIPANKIQEAVAWIEERMAVQPYKDNKIVNFEAWNAEALYFYDKDQNIVELIARKNTQPHLEAPFGVEQWLGISEIGAPTAEVANLCTCLIEVLPRYSGDLQNFAAIGDEEGLFIIINKDQRKWMPNQDPAFASPFDIQFQHQGQTIQWHFEAGQFTPLQ